ncbi:MAG: glucose-6-phosphate dehydrogenase assembly protein OpcA [Verrucomicrobia bacterium]|nr:glucose-6-phosphate dehydrogenase assembly protein OpcA [Verrucomicrobiota bacterium]
MTIQQIVNPADIEKQLQHIWEGLVKENKMRACLFNLIVYNHLSPRTDYFRNIVQKVVEKFPCRIIFISYDPEAQQPYLKTAVSVVAPSGSETTIACDNIDIGVAGPDLDRVPFLILPHIIPDLPVNLLWAEDPSQEHVLFEPLLKLAHRVIFDSESADNLLSFSKTLLDLKAKNGIEVADLNWARTEGWRDLLASTFDSDERISQLKSLKTLEISYNSKETEFFCHLRIQSMYLLAWLSSQLKWKFISSGHKGEEELNFTFEIEGKKPQFSIRSQVWEKLGPGTIISVNMASEDGHHYDCARIPQQYHRVSIQISNAERCDLPYQFVLGQTATGQSLVKEICTKGTSEHYLTMLHELLTIDRDKLC